MESADVPEGSPEIPSQAKPPKGKAFEGIVADYYRALGYRVRANIRLGGQEIDLLASRYIEGVGPLTLMVECKDWTRPVGNQDVHNFITTTGSLRANNVIHSGIMVSRSGFTPDGKAAAEGVPYVSLLTPDELEHDILDAAIGIRLLIQDYQDQDIYSDFVHRPGAVPDATRS